MSEHPPAFTQKHYEHMILAIRKMDWTYDSDFEMFVGVLSEIFEEDNPKFKPDMFRRQCEEGKR